MLVIILPIFKNYLLTRLNCIKLLRSSRCIEEIPNEHTVRGNRVYQLGVQDLQLDYVSSSSTQIYHFFPQTL